MTPISTNTTSFLPQLLSGAKIHPITPFKTLQDFFFRMQQLRIQDTSLVAQKDSSAIPPPPTLDEISECVLEQVSFESKKMQKNAKKALQEHIDSAKPDDSNAFFSEDEISKTLSSAPMGPIAVIGAECGDIGPRKFMEDAYLFTETEQGILAGICDGHSGDPSNSADVVAKFVSDRSKELFFNLLVKHKGNVRETFTEMFDQIEKEIEEHPTWQWGGTTAVFSFIDPKTNKIFTATIGDSESTLYRKTKDSELKAIPLSCLRNWTSEKDLKRFQQVVPTFSLDPTWSAKSIRYYRLNVSRALGDHGIKKLATPSALIHKAKITERRLLPGDKIVIACDGLKDYTSEQDVIKILKQNENQHDTTIVKVLIDFALDEKNAQDNVSVMVLSIHKELPNDANT